MKHKHHTEKSRAMRNAALKGIEGREAQDRSGNENKKSKNGLKPKQRYRIKKNPKGKNQKYPKTAKANPRENQGEGEKKTTTSLGDKQVDVILKKSKDLLEKQGAGGRTNKINT